ncbi:MAG TPA: aminomethyl-transferring glycine dehydrogenase subunit GcvPA, partial [Spirochaetota bacterium]
MGYASHSKSDVKEMLEVIGITSLDDLFSDIPKEIQLKSPLSLPKAMSEIELDLLMHDIASKNGSVISFAGAGSYNHHVPAVVDHLASRSEFYTAYTPYQPEVSQGTLTAIFEYQTMLCRLTGMDVANASMYDGATALAESVLMSTRVTDRKKIIISDTLHPHYRDVLKTYAWANGITIAETQSTDGLSDYDMMTSMIDDSTSAIVIQSPNFFGIIENYQQLSDSAHSKKVHLIHVTTEALSLALLKTPASLGADIFCGEGQSFGNYQGFGGPGLGILAAKESF